MRSLRMTSDYVAIWGQKPLLFEPGEGEQYSNYGYTLLGGILERITGMSYIDYVQENIFEPAGMDDTGFFETDRPEPNVAVGYTRLDPEGRPGDVLYKNIYLEPARGGPWGKTYSTGRDVCRFFEAFFDSRLLPAKDNWMPQGWETPGTMLAGGGPGLNSFVSFRDGLMVLVLANLDPPIAEDLAVVVHESTRNLR